MDAYDGNGICFPYDVLLDVLRRLPCRALAEARRVCREWRAAVDAHSLLLPHFFPPRAFPGIFTNNYGCGYSSFLLAPPASRSRQPRGTGEPDFRRPLSWYGLASIKHHCNGLLLLDDVCDPFTGKESYTCVCNPATVRCAPLPCPPMPWPCYFCKAMFLAFDPAVSRHYDVFLFHGERMRPSNERAWINLEQRHLPKLFGEERDAPGAKEPKAKPVPLLVFSSRTGQWESREFMPGRCAPGHLYDVMTTSCGSWEWEWSSEYWRGSLYVHCHSDILMILRCSEGTYDMVQLPGKPRGDVDNMYDLPLRSLVASYERGVRHVAINEFQLQVWTLVESDDGQLVWVLTHEANLSRYGHMMSRSLTIQPRMTWELVRNSDNLFSQGSSEETICNDEDGQDVTTDDVDDDGDGEEEVKSECSWSSEEHNFIEVDESVTDLGTPKGGVVS